jgi:hypothetical protein
MNDEDLRLITALRGEPLQQLAMDFTKRGRPELGGVEIERAAGMGITARGGSTLKQPVYVDKEGYKVEVLPRKPGQVLRFQDETPAQVKGNDPARMGEIQITDPKGQRARSGFWMDYWEPMHGVSKDAYLKLPVNERAALEAMVQGTQYAPLREQFLKNFKR